MNLPQADSTKSDNEYEVKILPDYDVSALQQAWKKIETRSDVHFFLSWRWIASWIEVYHPRFLTVLCFYQGRTVAIGLFTYSHVWRHRFVSSKQLRLHQTGIKTQDQIWIEYNDFIAEPEHRQAAVDCCLRQLLKQNRHWDELVLSLLSHDRANHIQQQLRGFEIIDEKIAYKVDLAILRKQQRTILESLSSNTRYQISRSQRKYEAAFGKIILNRAQTPQQAIDLFHQAGCFHKLRWDDSGFDNTDFCTFHEHLILHGHPHGEVDLLQISAGDQVIAILYNLIYQNRVYFYLSGIKYESDRKFKPGFVAHCQAIQHYLNAGYDVYDFLGGQSQYKASLSTSSYKLSSLKCQRSRLRFKIENIMRNIKHSLGRH